LNVRKTHSRKTWAWPPRTRSFRRKRSRRRWSKRWRKLKKSNYSKSNSWPRRKSKVVKTSLLKMLNATILLKLHLILQWTFCQVIRVKNWTLKLTISSRWCTRSSKPYEGMSGLMSVPLTIPHLPPLSTKSLLLLPTLLQKLSSSSPPHSHYFKRV